MSPQLTSFAPLGPVRGHCVTRGVASFGAARQEAK